MKTKLREKKVRLFGKSIPLIAIVAVGLIVGIAGAALVTTLTTIVTINEPIINTEIEPDVFAVVPGEEQTVVLTIDNEATEIAYGLTVIPETTYTGPEGDVVVSAGIPDAEITNGDDEVETTYNIPAATTDGTITYTVTFDAEAQAEEITISFPVIRGATFGA